MRQVNIRTPDEVKKIRKEHKLSQSDLCIIMGMSGKSYWKIRLKEQGKKELTDLRYWDKLDKQFPVIDEGLLWHKIEDNEKESRATFIIKDSTLRKLKAIAYWDRITIKQVVNKALENIIKKYEKREGTVELMLKNK